MARNSSNNRKRSSSPTMSTSKKSKNTSTRSTSTGLIVKPSKQSHILKERERLRSDPRFVTIKRIVEEQATDAFQHMLFSLAEKLWSLVKMKEMAQGVGKFDTEDDYIPNWLWEFKPVLSIHLALLEDQEFHDKKTQWEDYFVKCKNILASHIAKQSKRNLKAMQNEHCENTVCKLIEMGCIIARHNILLH